MHRILFAVVAFLTAAFMPPLAGAAERMMVEPEAGKAVIFIVRQPLDSDFLAPVDLDGRKVTTQPGTYYRWDVAPGTHRISAGGATVNVQARAGEAYFVRYTVHGGGQSPAGRNLTQIESKEGRELMAQAKPLDFPAPAAGGNVKRGSAAPLPGEKSSAQGSATEGRSVGN